MSSQWNTRAISKTAPSPSAAGLGNGMGGGNGGGDLMAESVVILMQGKNPFGDRIYSYLKITLGDLKRMQLAVQNGEPFNPSDFGTVVAAGKGDPTDEVKGEMAALYKVYDPRPGAAAPAAPPPQQKAWDEY